MKKINPTKLLINGVIILIAMIIGISVFSNGHKENKIQDNTSPTITPHPNPSPNFSNLERGKIESSTSSIPPLSKTEGFGEGLGGEVSSSSLTLITGSTKTTLTFTEGQTFFEILNSKENLNKIKFKGMDYTGIGFFITDIGELHSGGGKYLLYYVNGVQADSGISIYKPKVNDVVEWKLE